MGIINRFKKEKEQTAKESVAKKVTEAEKKVVATKKPVSSKSEKKEISKDSKKAATSVSKISLQTLVRPIVSEKSAQLNDNFVIVFEVARNANRVQVRNAFRELYKVTPVKVNIMNVRGKRVRFGRIIGKRNDYKKALITLPKGTRVDIFEGV